MGGNELELEKVIDRNWRSDQMCDIRVSLCVPVKQRNNWHRHDYTEPDDGSKPVQAGTPVFIKELQTRTFARYPAFTAILTPRVLFCLEEKTI